MPGSLIRKFVKSVGPAHEFWYVTLTTAGGSNPTVNAAGSQGVATAVRTGAGQFLITFDRTAKWIQPIGGAVGANALGTTPVFNTVGTNSVSVRLVDQATGNTATDSTGTNLHLTFLVRVSA